jgi:hypothetical protein
MISYNAGKPRRVGGELQSENRNRPKTRYVNFLAFKYGLAYNKLTNQVAESLIGL